ncbi:histidine phosphatase family protein [Phaeacidiphilus oryzae]|uniref:histidine phosphatase family protein n=1 Tax=Phaeacidiphilus oryzae TaxID=348818 RepID=UPI00056461FA|nr:histidine phosphatase family protein [Phaeacidiphilus oryzae]
MRLLLIRHGQTSSNVSHSLDTAVPGAPLTELGQGQAEALLGTLADERIAAVYASDLIRTQQTIAPLAAERGLETRIRGGLREIAAGDLEMADDPESIRIYMRTVLAWASGDTADRMPGAETGDEFLARYDAVVEEAADRAGAEGAGDTGAVALVSHGAAIRTWTAARAENVDPVFIAEHGVPNTGVVVLEGSPGAGWKALSWAGEQLGG